MRNVILSILTTFLCTSVGGCSTDRSVSLPVNGHSKGLTGREVRDIEGRVHVVCEQGTRGVLLVFTSQDCPVANSYARRIQQISDKFSGRGIRCFLIHVDPRVSSDQLREHAHDYGLRLPIVHDDGHEWVRRTGATVTPQAVLLDRLGRTIYSGRIDDQFVDFGARRREPTRHDLIDALETFLAGRQVEPATTQAVGCYIADLTPAE